MASNKNKECPNCDQWISTYKGEFKHHIRSCQLKVMKFSLSESNYIQSTNPLLFYLLVTTNKCKTLNITVIYIANSHQYKTVKMKCLLCQTMLVEKPTISWITMTLMMMT